MKILLIDNYDSFTFNLYHYLSSLKTKVDVIRNDEITSKEILKQRYQKIVISPGPGNPNQAGNCLKIVKNLKEDGGLPKLPGKDNFLFKRIIEKRQTLPFCKKWLKNDNIKGYPIALKNLVGRGIVNSYPPIMSQKGTYVAQHEHTIFIGSDKVSVLSE